MSPRQGTLIGHVTQMLEVLETARPGATAELTEDALKVLSQWPGISLSMTPERSTAIGTVETPCSVAGHYDGESEPPALYVAKAASVRRRHFTALHEFGHHLQQTDRELGRALQRQDDDEQFEERACDLFASRVLLPDALVSQTIGERGPDVESVEGLFANSNASRAACCVRAAQLLASPGCVVLLNPDGTVSFAASSGEVFPPARGSDQSSTPLVKAALANPDRTVERDTHVLYRSGHTSANLSGQVGWVGDYIIAVMGQDRVAWKRFTPSTPSGGGNSTSKRFHDCEVCVSAFPVDAMCARCGTPECPSGHCRCTLATERQCPGCNMKRHKSQFIKESTDCLVCREGW